MTTRVDIRREIGRRLQQPFFRRIGNVGTASTSGTTTTLVDSTKLVQADDFWNAQNIYLPAQDLSREIADFVQSTKTISWLEPVPIAVANADTYEIWSQFTAGEVNDAINAALRQAWPDFFTVTESFVVIKANAGLRYTISSLSPRPRWLAQVWFEGLINSITGTVDTVVAQNRLKDTTKTFTSDDVGKEIRIYEGTSAGDVRTVSSLIDSNTLQVSSNFTAILATDSKYRLADVSTQTRYFDFQTAWGTDSESNPSVLTLGAHPYGWEGYVMKLIYEAEPETLTTESATLMSGLPLDWLIWKALVQLYVIKLSDSPASEQKTWAMMHQIALQNSEGIAAKQKFSHVDGSIHDEMEVPARYMPEYPF